MRVLRRVALGATLAAIVGLSCAGTAGAYSAAVEPAGSFTWSSSLLATFSGGEIAVRCRITFEGELAESIANIESGGESMGTVSGFSWSLCEGGEIGSVLGLPWGIQGRSTFGLPNEVSSFPFLIQGMAVSFSVFGGFLNCLYGGEVEGAVLVSGSNPYSTFLVEVPGSFLYGGGGFCPGAVLFYGTFWESPVQEVEVI